jgi:hypothetical protein
MQLCDHASEMAAFLLLHEGPNASLGLTASEDLPNQRVFEALSLQK